MYSCGCGCGCVNGYHLASISGNSLSESETEEGSKILRYAKKKLFVVSLMTRLPYLVFVAPFHILPQTFLYILSVCWYQTCIYKYV